MSILAYKLARLGAAAGGGTDEFARYANRGAFPAVGETDTLYLDESNGSMWWWNGIVYRVCGFDTDSAGKTVLIGLDGVPRAIDISRANTLVIAGDSLANNNWSTASNNFAAIQANGALEVANMLMGQPFRVIAEEAVGGATHAAILTSQMPLVAAWAPKFCFIGSPYNDLYTSGATGEAAANATIALIQYLIARGITPIWHTVHARTYDSVLLKFHLDCNDRLRNYAATNYCGIFWDAFKVNVDITNANCEPRAGWTYDSAPQVHWNRTQGYYQARALEAACVAFGIERSHQFSYGAENQTNTATGRSNILLNPNFTGTTGTLGANVTGSVPTSWTVDWATRAGTGTAVAAIVGITDPDTGLVVANGIELTLGGVPAANDVLRITQDTGFNTLLSGGDLMSVEGIVTLAAPVAIQEVAMRVQANTNESTWVGTANTASGAGTVGDIPVADTFHYRSRKLAVLGTGAASQARYDLRVKFSGAASGVITLSSPRVRKG